MKNCSNCGVARKAAENFCLNCGTRFETNEGALPLVDGPKKRSNVSPKQKKIRIASLITIVGILGALFGTHLYFQSKYDVSKTLVEMNQAYSKGDQTKFLSLFHTNENVLKDEAGFFTYIEEQGWADIRSQMKLEASQAQIEGLSNIIEDSYGNKLISVVNDPIFLGLYNHISFLVHPIKVESELPFDQTTIVMKDVTTTGDAGESVVVGQFLPGNYNWKSNVESEYSPIEGEGSITILGDGKNNFSFSPSLDAGMVTVTSDIAAATIWINGKSTGKTVNEMNTIGPVPFNETIKVSAESKDGNGVVVKGTESTISSDKVHIAFAHIQEKVAADRTKRREAEELRLLVDIHESGITNYIDSYRYDFEDALNYMDFSYIADYFETGSKVQTDYISEIERHASLEVYFSYDFQSNTVTGIKALDRNTIVVSTAELFYFSSDGDEFRYTKTKEYIIKIIKDQYYIHDIKVIDSEYTEV